MEPGGDGSQAKVFEADVEAAEGYLAAGMRAITVVAAMGLMFVIPPLWEGLSFEALLFGVGGFLVGSLAAGGFGWHDAECRVRSVLGGTGATAAAAARRGWWDEYAGVWQALVALHRYAGPSLPADHALPPGMTREEYGRASKCAEAERRRGFVPYGAVLVWIAIAALATSHVTDGDSASAILVLGAACWLPIFLVAPSAWLYRWRQRRDELARAAGAASMREFMETRGWVWYPLLGWMWKRKHQTPD